MAIILDTEKEDFDRAAMIRFIDDNFELTTEKDPLPTSDKKTPAKGYITVKHRKSGVTRTYKTGPGTAWIVEFKNDLKAKIFPLN